MQFRFINTPAIFQRKINYILKKHLDNFIIYLNSKKEHKEYIKWVLSKLYKENIPVTVKKCEFHIKKTNFIGFIIKLGQISNLKGGDKVWLLYKNILSR